MNCACGFRVLFLSILAVSRVAADDIPKRPPFDRYAA